MPANSVIVQVGPLIRVVVGGGPGAPGKSAYQSYRDTTSDDPILTESQWVASLSAVSVRTVDANGVEYFVDSNGTPRFITTYPTNPYP